MLKAVSKTGSLTYTVHRLMPYIAIAVINDVVTVNEDLCREWSICIKVCPGRTPYEVKQ